MRDSSWVRPEQRGTARRRLRASGGWLVAALVLCALLLGSRAAQAQQSSVSGVVLEAGSLRPLAGAQVFVAGTGQGTLTDSRGRFLLTGLAGSEAVLRVQLIGYQPLSESVRVGSTDVRLVLRESAIELDEVVITGTAAGVQQRRAVGNVVAQIDVDDVVEKAPITTVGQLLNARAPGVVLQNTSGVVGAGPRITIRGSSSLSLSTEPLLYIDGVRVDNAVGVGPGAIVSRLNDLDPTTIESVEIIKGPAAATLYGTEAANGVIQVITKKGTAAGTPSIGLMIRQGANWFMDAENRFPTYYWRNPETGAVQTANLLTLERERGTPVFSTGYAQGYGLEVRGGSGDLRYYVASDYADNEGVEPNNRERRFNGRVNLSFSPRESFDINTTQGVVIGRTQLAATGASSVLTRALWGGLSLLNAPSRGFLSRPPEAIWAATDYSVNVNRYTGSFQLNHRPFSWFTHRLTTGVDLTDEEGVELTPRMSPELARFYSPFAARGSKFVDQRNVLYTTVDYSGTVTRPLTPALGSATSLGGQFYRRLTKFVELEGREFPAEGIKTVAGAASRLGSDDFVENTTVGVYVQQQFSWRDRIFVTGAVRADDNSAFGENFDFVTYPKVSATWVVNEEPFWRVPFVDQLKLRAAYGASGQQPEAFAAIQIFRPRPGPGGGAAVTPASIGNPDLGPERGEELELGFDAGLFGNRASLELTYYNQRTEDAILLRETAPSLGFPGSQFVNAGEISNRGLELLVSGRAVEAERVDWDVSVNFSTNDSEILDLGDQEFIPRGEVGGYRVGYPVQAFFAKRVVSARLDDEGNATDVLCDGGPGNAPVPCRQAPRVYLGRATPRTQGAVSSTLTFLDRLRLYALVDFQAGYRKFNKEFWNRCPWGISGNCPELVFPERFDAERIAEIQMGDIGVSSTSVENGSFAKLREVSLSYTLPEAWATSFGASRASITVAGRNLRTWTDYTGFDPEALAPAAFQASRWGDQGALPQLAQFLTTINLTF